VIEAKILEHLECHILECTVEAWCFFGVCKFVWNGCAFVQSERSRRDQPLILGHDIHLFMTDFPCSRGVAVLDKTFSVVDRKMFVQQRNPVLFVGSVVEKELTDWPSKTSPNRIIDEARSRSQRWKRIVRSCIVHDYRSNRNQLQVSEKYLCE